MLRSILQPVSNSRMRVMVRRLRRHDGLRALLVLVLVLLARSQVTTAAPLTQAASYADSLLISEYIDGSDNNKFVEIYNGTDGPINLDGYKLEVYNSTNNNSEVSFNQILFLNQVQNQLASGEAIIIMNANASAPIAGYRWDGLIFDGNDAVVLRRRGTQQVVDSIGQLNNAPPAAWSSGNISTKGMGMRRKVDVCTGRADATDPFNPADEWLPFASTDYTNLGSHQVNCPAPLLNEFVYDHIGNDESQYIEVKFQNSRVGDQYWVLAVDGNRNANPGQIYYSRQIFTAEIRNGYWFTGFLNQQLRSGTNTFLLVRNFSGVPQDIDVDNNGVIDTPQAMWSDLVDSVGVLVNSGDLTYTRTGDVVLTPNFDGVATAPGGASRIPDGQTLGTFQGWTRNHLSGENLPCAQCVPGATSQEAVNTPGNMNRLGTDQPTATPSTPVTPTPVTPIPPPTLDPSLPPNCQDIIVNGDFETNMHGWKFGDDPVPPRFSGDQRRDGLRSVLLGNPPDPGSRDVVSYSSIRQLVSIPKGATIAYLSWSQLALSQEPLVTATSHTDRQEFIPLAPNQMPISIKYRVLLNNANWTDQRVDLTDLLGKNFYVYFNVYNDGNSLRTWMYLDNVRLVVCYPEGTVISAMQTPTPMPLATAAPLPEPTPTFTPTPPSESPLLTPLESAITCIPPVCGEGYVAACSDDEGCLDGCGYVCVHDEGTAAEDIDIQALSRDTLTDTRPVTGSMELLLGDSVVATSAAPPGCVELINNGGFEISDIAWNIPPTDDGTGYTTNITYEGSRQSMRIGSIDTANLATLNLVEQDVELLDDYPFIRLEYRYYPLHTDNPGPGDLQYLDIYNALTDQFEMRVMSEQRDDRTWLLGSADLSEFVGQTIRLRFAVNNDGVAGRSAMYVDNVSILACSDDIGAGVSNVVVLPPPQREQPGDAAPESLPTSAVSEDAIVVQDGSLLRLGSVAVMLGILALIGLLTWLLFALRDRWGTAILTAIILVTFALCVIYVLMARQELGLLWTTLSLAVLVGFLLGGLYILLQPRSPM